jgi:hypothetical protein
VITTDDEVIFERPPREGKGTVRTAVSDGDGNTIFSAIKKHPNA